MPGIEPLAFPFVNAVTGDYVRVNPCPHAETVIASIGGWFEDDNGLHPHRRRKMLSPREF
jgi:hypothetical protein